MTEQDRLLLEQLISVLYEQSQAIQALASSNMALVRAMAESDDDTDDDPLTYMDGTPRQ